MSSASAINSQCSPCSLCENYTRSRTAQVITMIVGVILLSLSLYFNNGMTGVSNQAIFATGFSGIVLSTIPIITLIWRGCQNPTKALHRNLRDDLFWKEEPNIKEVRYLIKQGAKVNDRILATAIAFAKKQIPLSLELVRLLLDNVERVDDLILTEVVVTVKAQKGKVSLELLKLLLEKVGVVDENILQLAIPSRSKETELSLEILKLFLEKVDKIHTQLLIDTIQHRKFQSALLLLDYIDDVNVPSKYGQRVLAEACNQKSLDLVLALLRKGANPNLTYLNRENQPQTLFSPLSLALNKAHLLNERNETQIVSSLRNGEEIDLVLESDTQVAIVLALLKAGAKDNTGLQSQLQIRRDSSVRTDRSVRRFHPFVTTLLVDHRLPLIQAVQCQELSTRQWENLLKVVSDEIELPDANGMTPLMHAVKADNLTAVSALRFGGANPDTITTDGHRTARDFIIDSTNPEIVQLLRTANPPS